MSTFLELVNDVARESGTIDQSQELESVDNATGRLRRIVGWTRQAYQMIQRSRDDWTFMRSQFASALTASKSEYSASDFEISDFGSWMRPVEELPMFSVYDPDIGRGDEIALMAMEYRAFLSRYDVGTLDEQRPNIFAIGFDDNVHVAPTPHKTFNVRGWYRRSIHTLTADNDIPIFSADYHQAIVWRALMLLGDDDEAQFEVASSSTEFREIYSHMVHRYTEPVVLA